MLNVSNLSEYRSELKKNRQELQRILDGGSTAYPCLSKRLRSYNSSLGKKLDSILSYAIEYGQEDDAQFISRGNAYRGYECMLSYEMMTALYGGSTETWWRSVQMLSVLGLLYIHKPDMHKRMSDENPNGNTAVQEYSRKRAENRSESEGRKIRTVNWYSFPRFSEAQLAEAEQRAAALEGLSMSSINKDAVRDLLGEAIANTAYDTPFGISDNAEACREVIRQVVQAQLLEHGYTTPEAVITEACNQIAGEDLADEEPMAADEAGDIWDDILDDRRARARERAQAYVRWIWRAYKPILFAELGLKYSAPSKAEKEAFHLQRGSWIIR